MLVTPTIAFLSLVFNFGTLLLLHGSDPNFVTTRRSLQSSIQTIEFAATETWSAIAVHYNDILSPPPASSSFPLVDRAEWIYRSCAVRILRSLDGSVSRSSCTPSPASSLFSSLPLPSASISITTDLTLYAPLPPTCSISDAPFVLDHVEHPWETLAFMETNFPRFWPLALCILVASAICIWFKPQDNHPSDTSGVETEPGYEAYNIDSVARSIHVDSDSTPSLNLKLGANSKPRIFPSTAGTSLPSLPIIVTTSHGRVLFNAELSLSSNRVISTSPSSLEFSVDVVAFRNLSFPFGDDSTGSEKPILVFGDGGSDIELDTSVSSVGHAGIIFDKIEDSEETTSISDAAETSASSYDQAIDTSTKGPEDLQHAPNSTTVETAPEPRIERSTENSDIGEPPLYILAGIEVDNDGGWQVSVNGRHGGLQNGNRARSDSRQIHEVSLELTQPAFGTKGWSRKGGMDVPGSIDPSAQTGLRPIRDLVPAGSGPTAQSDPPFAGGEDPAGRDQTATSPPSKNGDGTMPFPLNRSDGILDYCLLSGNTLVGGVSSAGAGGVADVTETIGECSASTVSLDQSLSPSTPPSPSTTASPLSPSLLALPSMASSRASVFVPGPIRHLIATTSDDYSGQPRRVIVDNIDSSTAAIADPTSPFSCHLLEGALQDLEIEATSARCFDGRVVGGVARYGVSYAVLDFPTHMDALIAVRQLRSYDPEGRWLAEFSDPNDGTFGGRMASGLLPASRSVGGLRALQELAAQLDLCEN